MDGGATKNVFGLYCVLVLISFVAATPYQQPSELPIDGTPQNDPPGLSTGGYLAFYGDSHNFPSQIPSLGDLLDIGAVPTNTPAPATHIPTLDGASTTHTQALSDYAMKFVNYDINMTKLESVDALGNSFTMQLQIFLQWEEWIRVGNLYPQAANSTCNQLCDTTHTVTADCCDDVWLPTLRLPDAQQITNIDSIVTDGKGFYLSYMHDVNCTLPFRNLSANSPISNCYRQRFWEITVDAMYGAEMSFQEFPFDYQYLFMDLENPLSSRTWFQYSPGSLEARASNLVQQLSADVASSGWNMRDVKISPICDVLSWRETFLTMDTLLVQSSIGSPPSYVSQAQSITQHLKELKCPSLKGLTADSSDTSNTSIFSTTYQDYLQRLNDTLSAYQKCLDENNAIGYQMNDSADLGKHLGWIYFNDTSGLNRVSFPCLIDAVVNLTTPGIRVTIIVRRYYMYYLVKLVMPMIVCVMFAFTAYAIQVEKVDARLMVVVPAAIALTALQVTVVATDVPIVSYIVPTTWLMLASYFMQLFIAIESILVYKIWKVLEDTKQGIRLGYNKISKWLSRKVNATLVDRCFFIAFIITYTIIVLVCMLNPLMRPPEKLDGVRIWNQNW